VLEDKMKMMAFLNLIFNLPKNKRVVGFPLLAKTTRIDVGTVEILVMKAMSLNLIKGKIDQVATLIIDCR